MRCVVAIIQVISCCGWDDCEQIKSVKLWPMAEISLIRRSRPRTARIRISYMRVPYTSYCLSISRCMNGTDN